MTTESTSIRYWLDPQTGQTYRAATHEHWLVENAALVGLQAAVEGLDPERDADELHLIGIRSGLVRISHNDKNLSVQYFASPAEVDDVGHAVRDFLRNKNLPPLRCIRVRNSQNGIERTLTLSQFKRLVDLGGRLFPEFSATAEEHLGLIVCHLVIGFLCALGLDRREVNAAGILFWGLVFSEVALLGVWIALIKRAELLRPIGVVAGLAYLLNLIAWIEGDRDAMRHLAPLVLCTFALAALCMSALRFTKLQLHHLTPGAVIPPTNKLQFSILQMMAATAVIAVLFALARSFGRGAVQSLTIILAPCLLITPLLATWAALGVGRLSFRIPLVLVMSLLPGVVPAFYYSEGSAPRWFWPTLTWAQGAISLATLVVIRSWGYRPAYCTVIEPMQI